MTHLPQEPTDNEQSQKEWEQALSLQLFDGVIDDQPQKHDSTILTPIPTPKDIIAKAKSTILYQDQALEMLSVMMYYHLKVKENYEKEKIRQFGENYSKYDPSNGSSELPIPKMPNMTQAPLFITGKTGSGKTYLVKELSKILDIDCLAINATHISNAGHKGMTLADVGDMLMRQVGENKEKAMFSVVFIDEFDKLFLNHDTALQAYHRSLATELLTIIEGTSAFPSENYGDIPSEYMLFILGGSFTMHQNKQKPIGFTTKQSDTMPKDTLALTSLGLPDELAGRIGQIIAMSPLTDAMMADILKQSPTSPLVRLRHRLHMMSCSVSICDDLIADLLAAHADTIEKFGVRGLYQAFNQLPCLRQILINAPEEPLTNYTLTKTGFTKKIIL